MTARLDRAPNSVVVTCSECPGFREVRGDALHAGRVAAGHDKREHGSDRSRKALEASIRRRPELSS